MRKKEAFYDSINDQLQHKLLLDMKDGTLNIDEYRRISRGFSTALNYLTIKQLSKTVVYENKIEVE
jgi:hypothetical protein